VTREKFEGRDLTRCAEEVRYRLLHASLGPWDMSSFEHSTSCLTL
jgi:hypothetical protein